jgi:hypothetical protein
MIRSKTTEATISAVDGLSRSRAPSKSATTAGPCPRTIPFIAIQQNFSDQVTSALNAWRDLIESMAERTFLAVYGSPSLQAAVGLDPKSTRPMRKAGKSPLHRQFLQAKTAELKSRIGHGGLRECVIRGALYVGRAQGSVDERSFETVRRMRAVRGDFPRLPLAQFEALVREQFFMLWIDEEAALAAIPSMLPADEDARATGLSVLREVLSARGDMTDEAARRLERIVRLFGAEAARAQIATIAPLPVPRSTSPITAAGE